MRKHLLSLVSIVGLLALSGCSSIVKKPEINSVKKVVILSIYANDSVPEKRGNGVVQGWDSSLKLQVAQDFMNVYANEFTKLGWQVVPPNKVIQTSAYKKAFEPPKTGNGTIDRGIAAITSFTMAVGRGNYFTPAGMHPIGLTDEEANNTNNFVYTPGSGFEKMPPAAKLGKFAKAMKVDAAIVVALDFCYEGGTWSMLGTGEANITAASSVKAVDPNGNMLVTMRDLQTCEDNGTRTPSSNSIAMIGGNLEVGLASKEKIRTMFQQAASGSARKAVQKISDAMK